MRMGDRLWMLLTAVHQYLDLVKRPVANPVELSLAICITTRSLPQKGIVSPAFAPLPLSGIRSDPVRAYRISDRSGIPNTHPIDPIPPIRGIGHRTVCRLNGNLNTSIQRSYQRYGTSAGCIGY